MRNLTPYAPLFALLASCGSAASGTDAQEAGGSGIARAQVTITANSKSRLMPKNAVTPGFSKLTAEIMTVDALAGSANDVSIGGPASLGSVPITAASSACETTGCRVTFPRVVIDSTLAGLMTVVSDSRGENTLWHTTYTTAVNANQVIERARSGGAIDTSAPAYVLAESALPALGKLLGADANTLVARGLCLGLVWSDRGEDTGEGKGFAGARIKLGDTGGTAPSLYYLNDDLNLLSTSGTNQEGLFVLVGPDVFAQGYVAPKNYSVPLTVQNATSVGVFSDARAIVRPGVVTVVPIIPRR